MGCIRTTAPPTHPCTFRGRLSLRRVSRGPAAIGGRRQPGGFGSSPSLERFRAQAPPAAAPASPTGLTVERPCEGMRSGRTPDHPLGSQGSLLRNRAEVRLPPQPDLLRPPAALFRAELRGPNSSRVEEIPPTPVRSPGALCWWASRLAAVGRWGGGREKSGIPRLASNKTRQASMPG